jgi:sirohydrochlorin cobaltochelatase
LSAGEPQRTTALLLAAHGERRPGAGNEGLLRLAAKLRARRIVSQAGCGFIKGAPSIGEAVQALTADEIVVYPLFLSDGYFTRVRLPELLEEATAGTRPRPHILPPLGLDPGFPALIAGRAVAAARTQDFVPARTNLVVLAHGSTTDQASRMATLRLTEELAKQRHFRCVRMALLEEEPSLREATADLPGPIIVMGLFAGDGRHGAADAPRLVAELGRDDVLFAGTIGNLDGIEELIASAAEDWMGRRSSQAAALPSGGHGIEESPLRF